jgi:hypothetical protein
MRLVRIEAERAEGGDLTTDSPTQAPVSARALLPCAAHRVAVDTVSPRPVLATDGREV